ncbi:MAG: hypothetical protein V1936_04650 [Patescibacteria group bacterium]
MTKIKIQTPKRSTVDLVIAHSREHLAQRPHLRLWESLSLSKIISPFIFALAGLVVLTAAIQIISFSDSKSPVFFAQGATDYAAQRNFYAQDIREDLPLHAAADELTEIKAKLHAAAEAKEVSQAVHFIGLMLVLAGLFYLHRQHNIFRTNRAGFTIRRIR